MKTLRTNSVWTDVAKRIVATVAGIAAASMFATAAHAQASATASTTASVEIADPITITKDSDLSFGTVVPSAAAGTVVVSTAGTRSVTGGVTELGGTISAAEYTVAGYGNSAFSITLPATVSLTGTGDPMTAGTFNHDLGGSPALSSGSASFAVGATLNVGANQAPGAYSGTFDVTVAYN